MKSLVFFNNKGGVGKTTLLCNVAAYLALEKGLKICVVDADPQCNSTQYFFNEDIIEEIYSDKSSFTIQSIVDPLVEGIGYQKNISTRRAHSFGVDVIPGDPRLAITEDLLAKDWGDAKAGEIRGIRTSLVFSQLLHLLSDYDLVLFDVGPSLGAINRAILLSADFFVSPMSVYIFSLRAFENIAEWIENWRTEWARGIENSRDP
ncbi:MAG: ParA family protein, partial [Pseudomonadota bacterium]|nr:ParA family protein [Pseudomonadota bacterium]